MKLDINQLYGRWTRTDSNGKTTGVTVDNFDKTFMKESYLTVFKGDEVQHLHYKSSWVIVKNTLSETITEIIEDKENLLKKFKVGTTVEFKIKKLTESKLVVLSLFDHKQYVFQRQS